MNYYCSVYVCNIHPNNPQYDSLIRDNALIRAKFKKILLEILTIQLHTYINIHTNVATACNITYYYMSYYMYNDA